MTSFSNALLDLLLPPSCALCGALGAPSPCPKCEGSLDRLDADLSGLAPHISRAFAVYPFRGLPGEAVRALKFARRTDLADWMAREIAAALVRSGLSPDVVVPVPIHWRRRAARGFNQSELLCERLPLPRAALALRRLRHTRAQSRLDPTARARNLQGAFVVPPESRAAVAGRSVLLVDDVVTSGHTARECANALRAAGAADVLLLAFAAGKP